MKARVVVSLLAALVVACGAPVTSTMAPSTASFAVSVSVNPDNKATGSFASPTTVALTIRDGSNLGGTVENLTFALRAADGALVAAVSVSGPRIIPNGGSTSVQVQLESASGSTVGPGKVLQVQGVLRDSRGETQALDLTLTS